MVIYKAKADILLTILALINSELIYFYIKNKYSSSSYCGGITFTSDMINHIPISQKVFSNSILRLTEQMLIEYDNLNLYSALNNLIFKAYNISKEEQKIIKSFLKK